MLGLNDVQESSLGLVFHFADSHGLPLLDLKDLRAVIQYLLSDEGKAELEGLGALSKATAGVILRALIGFEDQGADAFFGEVEFDTGDLLRTRPDGSGTVWVLELPAVQDRPALFSTFLMWLLADLYDDLPEVGRRGPAQAGLLLRRGAPALRRRLEGLPRRDRADCPPHPVEGGGRVLRHPDPRGCAGRGARPARQPGPARLAGVHPERRQSAQGDRVDVPQVLLRPGGTAHPAGHRRGRGHRALGARGADTGRLDAHAGAPQSLMAPSDPAVVGQILAASPLAPKYAPVLDRESAYERLAAKLAKAPPAPPQPVPPAPVPAPPPPKREPTRERPSTVEQVLASPAFKSVARAAATTLGREISRTIFGTARRRRR